MVIRITWPHGVEFDVVRMRAHADWYKRQVARWPDYGTRRFARRAQLRAHSRVHREGRTTPTRVGNALVSAANG